MSEERHTTPERPATDRAEEMLSRLGQRFNDVRSNMGRAFDQRAQRQSGGAGAAQPTSQRAEDTLSGWGERVGYFAGTAGLRLRQWGARAREEAEDLWAEAQSMREQKSAGSASTGADTTATTEKNATETSHDQGAQTEQLDESAQPS